MIPMETHVNLLERDAEHEVEALVLDRAIPLESAVGAVASKGARARQQMQFLRPYSTKGG